MIALDSPAAAQAAAAVRGVAWLVDLEFSGGTSYVTTAPLPIVVGGITYTALGTLAEVGNLGESADATSDRLQLSLSVVNAAMFALAMGDPATYRGRRAKLWLQLLGDTWQPVGAPNLRWQGYMDKLSIERNPATVDNPGDSQGHIRLECSRAGLSRARRAEGLRMTDAQQQVRFPGDTGRRYVRTLIEKPSPWLSKDFQKI